MRETDKLDVVLGIRAQAADRNGHTVLQIAIQAGLRTVILAEIMQELLRRARQLELDVYKRQLPYVVDVVGTVLL